MSDIRDRFYFFTVEKIKVNIINVVSKKLYSWKDVRIAIVENLLDGKNKKTYEDRDSYEEDFKYSVKMGNVRFTLEYEVKPEITKDEIYRYGLLPEFRSGTILINIRRIGSEWKSAITIPLKEFIQ